MADIAFDPNAPNVQTSGPDGTGALNSSGILAQLGLNIDPSAFAPVDLSKYPLGYEQNGMTVIGDEASLNDAEKVRGEQEQLAAYERAMEPYYEALMKRQSKGESFFSGLAKGAPLFAALLSGPLGPLLGGALGLGGAGLSAGTMGSALISALGGGISGVRSGGLEGGLMGALGGGLGSLGGAGLGSLLKGVSGIGGSLGAAGGAGGGATGALGGSLGDFAGTVSPLFVTAPAAAGSFAGALGGAAGSLGGSPWYNAPNPQSQLPTPTGQDWADFARLAGNPGALAGLPVRPGFTGSPVPGPQPGDTGNTLDPLTVTAPSSAGSPIAGLGGVLGGGAPGGAPNTVEELTVTGHRPDQIDPASVIANVGGLIDTPGLLNRAGDTISREKDKEGEHDAQGFLKKIFGFPQTPGVSVPGPGVFGFRPGGGNPSPDPFSPGPTGGPSGGPGKPGGPGSNPGGGNPGPGGGNPFEFANPTFKPAAASGTASPFGGGGAGPPGLGAINVRGNAAPDIYPWSTMGGEAL